MEVTVFSSNPGLDAIWSEAQARNNGQPVIDSFSNSQLLSGLFERCLKQSRPVVLKTQVFWVDLVLGKIFKLKELSTFVYIFSFFPRDVSSYSCGENLSLSSLEFVPFFQRNGKRVRRFRRELKSKEGNLK